MLSPGKGEKRLRRHAGAPSVRRPAWPGAGVGAGVGPGQGLQCRLGSPETSKWLKGAINSTSGLFLFIKKEISALSVFCQFEFQAASVGSGHRQAAQTRHAGWGFHSRRPLAPGPRGRSRRRRCHRAGVLCGLSLGCRRRLLLGPHTAVPLCVCVQSLLRRAPVGLGQVPP